MDKIFYFYPKDRSGRRLGHSVAVLLKDGKVFLGFSQLGSGDNFNRKIGRKIAESRAVEQYERFSNNQRRKANAALDYLVKETEALGGYEDKDTTISIDHSTEL